MKILVVGHGEYSTGIKSVIKLLTGVEENIDAINLNGELTHDEFTVKVKNYIEDNNDLIVFADITGGAPFQITSREILLNEKSENQYVIGGVSVACILEVVMNTLVLENNENHRGVIEEALNKLPEMSSVICRKDLVG